jgi:hypothetical protein
MLPFVRVSFLPFVPASFLSSLIYRLASEMDPGREDDSKLSSAFLDFAKVKLVPIQGDICIEGLGISKTDFTMLKKVCFRIYIYIYKYTKIT